MSTRSSFVRCVKLSGATKRVEPRIITQEDRTGNQDRVHKIHALVSLLQLYSSVVTIFEPFAFNAMRFRNV